MRRFSQMVKLWLTVLVVSCLCPADDLPKGWRMFAQKLPPALVLGDGVAEAQLEPGRAIDVRKYVKELGIEIPPGGVALYQPRSSSFVAFAPNDQVELLESLFPDHWCLGPAHYIRVTGTLAEMRTPPRAKSHGLSYSRLRDLAGESWKEIEQIQVSTKNGHRALARKRIGGADSKKTEGEEAEYVLSKDEAGALLEIEPVGGADYEKIDLSMIWQSRIVGSANAHDLNVTTSITFHDGTPIVVGQWPVQADQSQNPRSLILVVTAEWMASEGIRFRDGMADEARKLQRIREEVAKAKKAR